MNLLKKIIRKLFLVKEIISQQDKVHFRRYRLLQTPWFALYIHQICRSDEEVDPHDHPWNFSSLILKGSYTEMSWYPPDFDDLYVCSHYAGQVLSHKAEDAHKIKLLTPEVWTLVFTSGRTREWGYQTIRGWVDHKTYRKNKRELNESI